MRSINPKFIRWDARSFEIYEYHRTNSGNIAVVYMDDDPVTPWIVAHNVQPVNEGAIKFYEWDHGHYFPTKDRAVQAFHILVRNE